MKVYQILTPTIAIAALYLAPLATAGRDDYETPDYEVVESDGAFEVRDYPAMVVASAPMKSGDAKGNSAFMELFGYISGKNEAQQKIAMTTPVINSTEQGKQAMSFVVPKEVAKAGAPDANNGEIEIAERKGGRFAVYRYSGRWTEKNQAAATEKLMAWVKEQGLSVKGSVERASYDPPFTLPAFRRNEVMLRVGK